MKRIKTNKCTLANGAMGWRLGSITARKVLGGDVTLDDIQGYGPVYYWSNDNGWCSTGANGNVLSLELEV